MNKDFYKLTYSDKPIFRPIELKFRILKMSKMVPQGSKVLEVGCGFGYISQLIKDAGNDVYGIELSPKAVKHSKNLGIKVFELDLNDKWELLKGHKFDVVVLGEVIEHVFDTDALIEKIYKVLKPGGYLILSTPNVASFGRRLMLLFGINPILEYTARNSDAGHIRYFTFKNLRSLLKDHNFEVETYVSDYVTLDLHGNISSGLLAKLFPYFGRSLIVKAKKV